MVHLNALPGTPLYNEDGGLDGILKSAHKDLIALQDAGVEVRPIVAGNFVRNPVVSMMEYETHGEMDEADHIHYNGLFFGNHHYDISTEIENISEIISNFVGVS